MLDHVAASVASEGCDHTRKATDARARERGIDVDRLHVGLQEYGGYCDCEVVMNVDAGAVFEPVRRPQR